MSLIEDKMGPKGADKAKTAMVKTEEHQTEQDKSGIYNV